MKDQLLDIAKKAAVPVGYTLLGGALMTAAATYLADHPKAVGAVVRAYCQVDGNTRTELRRAVNETVQPHRVEIRCD